MRSLAIVFATALLPFWSAAQKKTKPPEPPPPVAAKGGHLIYAADDQGNRIPDFSYSGYKGGDSSIPNVPIRVTVPQKDGDATFRVQAALDYVASLPADRNGIRGAVLLEKGVFEIAGSLTMNHRSVILRGSGMGENGTILRAAVHDRRTLIRIAGRNDRHTESETTI